MPCLFPSVLIGAQVVHVCRHSLGERLVFMRDAGCPLLPAQARMGWGVKALQRPRKLLLEMRRVLSQKKQYRQRTRDGRTGLCRDEQRIVHDDS